MEENKRLRLQLKKVQTELDETVAECDDLREAVNCFIEQGLELRI